MSNALSIIDGLYGGKSSNHSTALVLYDPPIKRDLPQANYVSTSGNYGTTYAIYDGETNQGEFGPAKAYVKDWYTLRYRSKQLFTESLVAKGIVLAFNRWTVGDGLRPHTDPLVDVLAKEGIKLDNAAFSESFKLRWKAYAESRAADYTGKSSLLTLQKQAHLEAKLGGDMLVILRVVNGLVKVQHIDGGHVMNPLNEVTIDYADKNVAGYQGNQGFDYIYIPTGNRIRYGVEIDDKGTPIAYHVRVGLNMEFKRVLAKDSNGFLRAFLVFGKRFDLDAPRGSSLLETALENLKKLDRYFGAAVAGAEIRAKFAVFFEHDKYSVEDDPLAAQRAKTLIAQPGPLTGMAQITDTAIDAMGTKIASDVSVTMNGTYVNLPRGVKAHSLETNQELGVGEFMDAIIEVVCMGLEIPPNVAKGLFNDSFSASRMAGKTFEHTMKIDRADLGEQYLDPIKELQMYLWVLDAKIQAPGYLQKLKAKDEISMAAYHNCEWMGDNFPEVDDKRAADALRILMGAGFEHMPLISPEQAAKRISRVEYTAILQQSAKQKDAADALGIEDVLIKGETVDADEPDTEQPQPKKSKRDKPKGRRR
jgi:capsid protein